MSFFGLFKKKKKDKAPKVVQEPPKPVEEKAPVPTPVVETNTMEPVTEPVKPAEPIKKEAVEKPKTAPKKPAVTKKAEAPKATVEKSAPKTPKEPDKEKPAKYHVSQNKDPKSDTHRKWRVRKEGSTKTIKYFDTQKEAIAYAEQLAEAAGTSVVIHKMDGKVRKQNY